MAGKKTYVCTGAVLKCSMGTSNGSLSATPKAVSLCSREQANIADHVSMLNVKPFGLCRSRRFPATAAATSAHHGHLTPMPCVPGTATKWSAADSNSIVCGQPALLSTATLRCVYGGTITIVNPGQGLETTGADGVEIVTREIVVNDYFWADRYGNECDTSSTDAMDSPALCLQTSLSAGSQLVVNIGKRSYVSVVGKGGVARVENVDVDEVDLDLPSTRRKQAPPRELPAINDNPKNGTTRSAPEKKPDKSKPKTTPEAPARKPPKSKPEKAAPVKTGEQNVATVPVARSAGWGDPIANPSIRRNSPSHLYGKVRRDSRGNPRNHQGFDYYAPTGTPVMSVGDGVVHTIQSGHSSYGLNVTIRHKRDKGEVYSFYAHLSRLADGLTKGKVVHKGDVIAFSGTTGNAKGMTGPDQHLHFECRTSPGHQLGLGGKENPNNIVATKFTAESLKGGGRK